MTTITKYVCDLCGKTFEDEDECKGHEILEKFKYHSTNVVFFDKSKNVITAEQIINQRNDPWAIFIENEEAIPLVEEIYDFCILTASPWSWDGGHNRKMTGLYLYDEETNLWYLPADKIEKLKKEMKEYGVGA